MKNLKMDNEKRLEEHKKIKEVEELLKELTEILTPVELEVIKNLKAPQKPVFFIVGSARSGSTLLFQLLTSTNYFSYPTNLISRFYYAPFLGAKIQKLIIDYDFRNEINLIQKERNFSSALGKTFGALSPNEFWYFWNRFFKFGEIQKLTKDEFNNSDTLLFLKELSVFEYVFDKPLLMKAMNMNWNITELASLCENFKFIYIERDVLYNAQSLIRTRMKFFGKVDLWYSFKPPGYKAVLKKPYWQQVIHQVILNNESIEKGLSTLDKSRYIKIRYEDICKNPGAVINSLNKHFNISLCISKNDKKKIKSTNYCQINKKIFNRMADYLSDIKS